MGIPRGSRSCRVNSPAFACVKPPGVLSVLAVISFLSVDKR